jgi:hypothetical protein
MLDEFTVLAFPSWSLRQEKYSINSTAYRIHSTPTGLSSVDWCAQ